MENAFIEQSFFRRLLGSVMRRRNMGRQGQARQAKRSRLAFAALVCLSGCNGLPLHNSITGHQFLVSACRYSPSGWLRNPTLAAMLLEAEPRKFEQTACMMMAHIHITSQRNAYATQATHACAEWASEWRSVCVADEVWLGAGRSPPPTPSALAPHPSFPYCGSTTMLQEAQHGDKPYTSNEGMHLIGEIALAAGSTSLPNLPIYLGHLVPSTRACVPARHPFAGQGVYFWNDERLGKCTQLFFHCKILGEIWVPKNLRKIVN